MKRPAFQFYPADWRKDAALQSCSMAAHGLWVNMMCIAHECEPYGHLVVNAKPMQSQQIARLVGLSVKEFDKLCGELADAGVVSVSPEGAFFSRRMVRDESLRNVRANGGEGGSEFGHLGAEHGKKGGRPKKVTGDKKPPLHNEEQPTINPPPSSSSSTSVIKEAKASSSGSTNPTDADQKTAKVATCPIDVLIDLYEKTLPSMPRVRRSLFKTGKNGTAMRQRWAWVMTSMHERGERAGTRLAETTEQGVAWFDRYFTYVADSKFLTESFAACDLGWLLAKENFEKVLSGRYENREGVAA